MKAIPKYAALLIAGAAIGALALAAGAQPPEGGRESGSRRQGDRRPGPPEGRRPPPPLETALDADQDGDISAAEIENAVAALKSLDKNEDGKLTPDEYRPPRPPMDRDAGGRRGEFGSRGPAGDREGDRPSFHDEGRRPGAGDCPKGDEESSPEADRGRRGPPRDQGFGGPEANRSRRPTQRDGDSASPEGRRGRGGPPRDSKAFADRLLQFDDNGDGKVAKDELPEQMQQLLERGDTNDDGALDRAELERLSQRSGGGRAGRRSAPPQDAGGAGDRPRRPAEE